MLVKPENDLNMTEIPIKSRIRILPFFLHAKLRWYDLPNCENILFRRNEMPCSLSQSDWEFYECRVYMNILDSPKRLVESKLYSVYVCSCNRRAVPRVIPNKLRESFFIISIISYISTIDWCIEDQDEYALSLLIFSDGMLIAPIKY